MHAIQVDTLSKYFGKTKAVDAVSFEVEQGSVFGFLGPNGAGKTTTIRCMMDFLRPTNGSISILGMDSTRDSVAIKHRVGYLSGNVRLYDKWTGEEHITFAKKIDGKIDISRELTKRLDFDPTKKTKTLSSGNRQKLGLILAFMNQPDLLIMDEPTNALDPLLQNEVYELLDEAKQRGATIFMSSHNLSEVDRICTKVCIIKRGKIVATETINALKKMRLYSVHAHFKHNVPSDTFKKLGAQITEQRNDFISLKIKGDVEPMIRLLATLPVIDLQIEHASLEDIFLEYY